MRSLSASDSCPNGYTGERSNMNNEQLIEQAAASIWGEEAVQDMIMSGRGIPLHTVQGWKSRGNYYVKKGEHGLAVRLWRRKKGKGAPSCNDEEDGVTTGGFYLTKAYLFREDQMIKVEE